MTLISSESRLICRTFLPLPFNGCYPWGGPIRTADSICTVSQPSHWASSFKCALDLSHQNLDASDDFAVGQKSENRNQYQPGSSPLIINKLKKQEQDKQTEGKATTEAQKPDIDAEAQSFTNSEFYQFLPFLVSEQHWAIVMNKDCTEGFSVTFDNFQCSLPQP